MFVGGIAYVTWYKANVLTKVRHDVSLAAIIVLNCIPGKMELAFAAGYDPALELANRAANKLPSPSPTDATSTSPGLSTTDKSEAEGGMGWWETPPLRRDDQDTLDRIVHGDESGRYFMILGPKVRAPPYHCTLCLTRLMHSYLHCRAQARRLCC